MSGRFSCGTGATLSVKNIQGTGGERWRRTGHRFGGMVTCVLGAFGATFGFSINEAAATPTVLRTGTGDGYIQATVDEYGTMSGCSPTFPGLFDPLGPFPPQGTVCSLGLQIFDQAGTIKQPLPANAGGCGGGSPYVATVVAGSDVLVGTHSRFTTFTLSGFPGLEVTLWQTVCTGGILTQTYTFNNTAAVPYSLRLTRDGDIDIDVFSYGDNFGRLLAPGMPAVLDGSQQVSVAMLSGGDGLLEGYRIYQVQANAAQIFNHSWGSYGFPTANLNGFFHSLINPFGSACGVSLGVDETLISEPASLVSQGDTAIALQTLLTIPANASRTYVAQTLWGPAVPQNDPPAPNCAVTLPGSGPTSGMVTGRVTFDDDISCDVSGSETGSVGRWIRFDQGPNTYYTQTNANGDYSISLPPGLTTISLVTDPLSPESCPNTYSANVVSGLLFDRKDFFVLTEGCNATVGVAAGYPQNQSATHGLINQPCNCDIITYCVNVTNTGSDPLTGNVVATLPTDVAYLGPATVPYPGYSVSFANACSVTGAAVHTGGNNKPCCGQTRLKGGTLTWTLQNPVVPNSGTLSQCSICYEAIECAALVIPPGAPFSLLTNATINNNSCTVSNGSLTEQVICSRDPNSKEASPAGCGFAGAIPRGQSVDYTIHFQNEGNGPAHRVVIEDVLDASFDISTLEVIRTSHELTRLEILPDRTIVWDFDGIELPPLGLDAEGSQGLIEFRVSPLNSIADGTTLENFASIVFDHNEAIVTPTVVHTVWDEPEPTAAFAVTGECGSALSFAYTGNTPNVTFEWDFGAFATPSTSADGAPTGIVFSEAGLHEVTLTVDRDGCKTSTSMTVDVAEPVAQLTSYALLAKDSMTLEPNAAVEEGSIGVLSANGIASLKPNSGMESPAGWILADTLVLKPNAMVTNAFVNHVNTPSLVTGTLAPFAAPFPAFPVLPGIVAGTTAVNVPKNGTLQLGAGSFGAITVGKSAVLSLLGGTYSASSITVQQGAKVRILAPSEVRLTQNLTLDSNATFGPATPGPGPQGVVVHVQGSSVDVGSNAHLLANVNAPNAAAVMGPNSTLQGGLLANTIVLKPNSTATAEPTCY